MKKLLITLSLIPAAFGIVSFVFLCFRFVFFDYWVTNEQGLTAFIMMNICVFVSIIACIAVDESY